MWKMQAEESVSEWCTKRKTQMVTVAFEDGRGPGAKECGQPLSQKNQEMDSHLEPPKKK